MNLIGFLWFTANLLIAGALIRMIEITMKGTWLSQALGVIY